MRWYLTVTHISHCEIKSVTAMPLIYVNAIRMVCVILLTGQTSSYCQLTCNKQVSCFKYFKVLQLDIMAHNHSLIARYTRI